MRTLFLLALWFCGTPRSPAADYLFVDAKINDQPVRLTFDTGAEYTILF